MRHISRVVLFIIGIGLGVISFGLVYIIGRAAPISVAAAGQYKVVAWNDLGMHCYNRNFQDLAVLPPYNTLWAQVILVGDPPQLVTSGITVSYHFADNTYSVGKSNFWTYANALFGVPLADNVGLAGKGLAGQMDLVGTHFEAVGIPLTEFSDSAPSTPDPYQLATVIVTDSSSGLELARVVTVAPVSTEMHCDNCHADHGRANPNIATGRVETNILTLHDRDVGSNPSLMNSRPVLCAKCHASNALGMAGQPGVPSLSNAMHNQHEGEVPNTTAGCYNCHPGPQTRCLRDIMSQKGLTCVNCHGPMGTVAQNPNPWLNEPRCDNVACHGTAFAQDQALYRHSTGHGGLACEACHDSTHAIAVSSQPRDGYKFLTLQTSQGPLIRCTVCHATKPASGGAHGLGWFPIYFPFQSK
jgi:hypothetical protein